jgi:hypothetical protein
VISSFKNSEAVIRLLYPIRDGDTNFPLCDEVNVISEVTLLNNKVIRVAELNRESLHNK